MTPPLPPYSVREAAALLGINSRTAHKLIETGNFPVPVFTVGALRKVPRRHLDALVSGSAR